MRKRKLPPAKNSDHAFWRDDWYRVRGLKIPSQPLSYASPDATRLLRVQNEYFTAGAVFERREGVWRVKECAPILHWMRKVPFERIKLELLKRGCSWEWS